MSKIENFPKKMGWCRHITPILMVLNKGLMVLFYLNAKKCKKRSNGSKDIAI